MISSKGNVQFLMLREEKKKKKIVDDLKERLFVWYEKLDCDINVGNPMLPMTFLARSSLIFPVFCSLI